MWVHVQCPCTVSIYMSMHVQMYSYCIALIDPLVQHSTEYGRHSNSHQHQVNCQNCTVLIEQRMQASCWVTTVVCIDCAYRCLLICSKSRSLMSPFWCGSLRQALFALLASEGHASCGCEQNQKALVRLCQELQQPDLILKGSN